MRYNLLNGHTTFCLIAGLLLWSSCKKDKQEPLQLSGNNHWILDSMKVYYYWNDQLPQRPQDQINSTVFFKSLLSTADRFSFIVNPDDNRTEYSSFAWYGFEYALLEKQDKPGEFTGMITLVVPGGPADQQGLKRGDLFTSVNGVALNKASVDQVNRIMRLSDGLQLSTATLVNGSTQTGPVITINYSPYTEQPVYTSKVFNAGGKKAGYIFYNQFNGNYDRQILEVLNSMRNQGINELILDLRYNPGGDVSTAAKLAGALSKTTADQTFIVYQANKNGGRRISSFQKTISENSYQPQSFSELQNYRIDLNRIFILTTASTASAAELLINNLRPYLNVVQVGTKTLGKDMASFAIADFRNPRLINMVLHPLVFKLYNAREQGDYSSGLSPDYMIDEFASLPLLPFGDPADPMLRKALEIAGLQAAIVVKSANTSKITSAMYKASAISNGRRQSLPLVTKKNGWKHNNSDQ